MKKILIILVIIFGLYGTSFAEEPYTPATEAKLEYNQGVDYYKIGQYDKAMASFRRAINIDSNYVDAYYNLGAILEYLKQDDAALSVFKQIIIRKPDDYESLYKAAVLSTKLQQPERAKEYLSLIPPSSSIYRKAQELANSTLYTDMQTLRQQSQAKTNDNQYTRNDNAYDNIASPTGVATDNSGNVYVASFSDNTIYKITAGGQRVIFLKDSRIDGPIGMVRDGSGNLYVANYNSNNVLKINPNGGISVLTSNISRPYGLHIANGILFISSQGSNSVIRYKI